MLSLKNMEKLSFIYPSYSFLELYISPSLKQIGEAVLMQCHNKFSLYQKSLSYNSLFLALFFL